MSLRTVQTLHYLTPLREGGSLPAIVEADDQGTYVLKFRGAGQGLKVLIAEIIVGEMARLLDLPIPELVLMHLDPLLAQTEPDREIQELIQASAGYNLGMDYLPGSISFDPLSPGVLDKDPLLAAKIVWLDAFTTNVDRTPRNPNLLVWHRQLWLIDHGASLYFQHSWKDIAGHSRRSFAAIKDHVLLPFVKAGQIEQIDADFSERLTPALIEQVLAKIPEDWLNDEAFETGADQLEAYRSFLLGRLAEPRAFVEEAIRASQAL